MLSPATVLSSNADTFTTVIVWMLFVGLAVLAIKFLTSKRLLGLSAAKSPNNLSLQSKPILTDAEAKFLRSLEIAVGEGYLVWPQLPLWTFIETRSNDSRTTVAFKNKINLKRVDFCLVDRQTLTVQMAIELDDRTHQRVKTQRRDAFVEQVLKQADVPLIRIPGAAAYDSQVIRKQLGMDNQHKADRKMTASLAR